MDGFLVGGFDSAWGAGAKGALAYLEVKSTNDNPKLRLAEVPRSVSWQQATADVVERRPLVLAIDQPLIVQNPDGCRPVERTLAQRLHAAHCAAYPANLTNPCFQPNAPIWRFLHDLNTNGFEHDPFGAREDGSAATKHRYVECYPHLAILGLSGLDRILKYKVRHANVEHWQRLLQLIAERVVGFDPADFARQTKANEDRVDAVVCAIVAAQWSIPSWDCALIGSLATGYMVTPMSTLLRERLDGALVTTISDRPNSDPLATSDDAAAGVASPAVSLVGEGADNVQMVVNDTGCLWASRNPWLTRHTGFDRLRVTLIDEDGAPEMSFVPFEGQGGPGVKIDRTSPENLAYWSTLVAGASSQHLLSFQATARYEP